ncbi:MAG TPA: hypothetical protein VH520_13095 [Streptosporangiaceae bacterium]|jgi:hypothetical protein
MNADQVATLRALLAPTGWVERTSAFAHALRRSARTPSGLLIFGPAGDEPWHMTAHLADESEYAGIPELAPTLVRWAPEPGAPPHLSVGLSRLAAASPRETLLVVSRGIAPDRLLERVHDVRRSGATVFAIDQDDAELDELAHESLQVSPSIAPISFEAAQHLVTAAVSDVTAAGPLSDTIQRAAWSARGPAAGVGRGMRARLARLLDTVTGTPED